MLSWHRVRVIGYDPIYCLIDDDTQVINIGELIDLSLEAEDIFLKGDNYGQQFSLEVTERYFA